MGTLGITNIYILKLVCSKVPIYFFVIFKHDLSIPCAIFPVEVLFDQRTLQARGAALSARRGSVRLLGKGLGSTDRRRSLKITSAAAESSLFALHYWWSSVCVAHTKVRQGDLLGPSVNQLCFPVESHAATPSVLMGNRMHAQLSTSCPHPSSILSISCSYE